MPHCCNNATATAYSDSDVFRDHASPYWQDDCLTSSFHWDWVTLEMGSFVVKVILERKGGGERVSRKGDGMRVVS